MVLFYYFIGVEILKSTLCVRQSSVLKSLVDLVTWLWKNKTLQCYDLAYSSLSIFKWSRCIVVCVLGIAKTLAYFHKVRGGLHKPFLLWILLSTVQLKPSIYVWDMETSHFCYKNGEKPIKVPLSIELSVLPFGYVNN